MSFNLHFQHKVPASLGVLVVLVLLATGCSRPFYRLQADKEARYLVLQKSNDPRWQLDDFTIGMDTRSRYFDPTSPDCPPMPYDDPASHRYMHCVAGKKGWPCWHMSGDWFYLENPRWKDLLTQYNETTQDGAIKLTQNGSVCLARVHSSDYRYQIENLYLSALDVSTERFRFDVQFFGNSNTVFTHTGEGRSAVGERNALLQGNIPPDTTVSFTKEFSTGAELMVGFANSFVWQFAGNDTSTTTSLLNFSLVQPLLRGGGRAVVLETLTLAERALLGNLRAFQRYRQGFYTNISVGGGPVQGVNRRGGFLGGTGLTGFTGTGAGGIGGVATGQFGIQTGNVSGGGGGGGGTGFAGGGAGPVGGFVGLLQQKQQVRNAEANLNAQLRTLGLLEANLDAGLIDIVQVDSFRQNIETARANLLTAEINLQTALDTFKSQLLTLPPDTAVELDDSMLEQFQFLDPKTIAVQHSIDDFVRVVGELPPEPETQDLVRALDVLTALRGRLADQFKSARADMEKLQSRVAERKERMDAKQKTQFDEDLKRLAESLADVETRFEHTAGVMQNLRNSLATESRGKITDETVALGVSLSGLTQELALVKARARLESVTVPQIKLDSRKALEIARANRLDWMNNRASLVDTWRLIAFNANALKSGLDLTFSGDVGNTGSNPLQFSGDNTNLRVGLRFDAPFTRRVERNAYRQALITYEQTRRSLYQFQDGVNQTLRSLLRTLEFLEIDLEIQRRAVIIAVRRVDKTREDLNKPPAPVQPGQPVESLGPTVAQNLIFALNDLTSAQNNFMSVVLNHYENRMFLYRELGIMELDDCGMWIDKPLGDLESLSEAQSPMPPGVPQDWMNEAGFTQQEIRELKYDDDRFPPPAEAEDDSKSVTRRSHGEPKVLNVEEIGRDESSPKTDRRSVQPLAIEQLPPAAAGAAADHDTTTHAESSADSDEAQAEADLNSGPQKLSTWRRAERRSSETQPRTADPAFRRAAQFEAPRDAKPQTTSSEQDKPREPIKVVPLEPVTTWVPRAGASQREQTPVSATRSELTSATNWTAKQPTHADPASSRR